MRRKKRRRKRRKKKRKRRRNEYANNFNQYYPQALVINFSFSVYERGMFVISFNYDFPMNKYFYYKSSWYLFTSM